MAETSDVTSLRMELSTFLWRPACKRKAYKETSCFQTGLCAESRPNKLVEFEDGPALVEAAEIVVFAEETDDAGDGFVLPLPLFATSRAALEPMAPKAERALLELLRERLVAVPLTSFPDSSVGSRLTNSFCSN
jgi:hypothetical protein